METQKSIAYKFVEYAWNHENTNSFLRINNLMSAALNLAIEANMKFHKDDISTILEKMSGGYWFGSNLNGKGIGEGIYITAIQSNNTSAIKSYEAYTGLKPFISAKGHRMHLRSQLRDTLYRYTVTGFDFTLKRIYLVAYLVTDYKEEGTRKLFNFNKKEWLKFRKTVVE